MYGAGWGVGFVFTENDPLFFLDIDNCLVAGQWSPLAVSLSTTFAGCAIEVSQSGTGLHIFGSGKPPAHSCRNQALGLEFYTSGRFVALTGINAVGDVLYDASPILPSLVQQYFPAGTASAESEWTTEPVAEWRGPVEDADLIRRAMNSKSTASAFGSRAAFSDLWLANEAALAVSYPDAVRPYDASAADAALAQHLAFWTGNNCERIKRIMLRPECCLLREKYEREDYLPRTITGAVSRQVDVCNDNYRLDEAKRRQEQIAENIRVGEDSDTHPSSSVLTQDEMLARYVNVIEGKRVVDLEHPRRIFALDEWKSAHKASRTEFEVEGRKLDGTPKTKSYENSRLWEMSPDRLQVDTVTFRPGHKAVTVDPDGKQAANTWRPTARTPATGDCSHFLQHVSYLFGSDSPRFLDWLAHIEQQPGELPHSGWIHVSPMQGTGRNWLASVLCRLWRGHVAASFDLAGTLRTGFNGPLSQKMLAIVDEIDEGGANARWENAEVLKTLVTSEHRHVNPKYGHQRLEWNACRWLIFSNHTSALPLTERDRRFNVVRNENPPMPSEYYGRLYKSLRDSEFIDSVAWMLKTRDISKFNPGEHAVMNDAKRDLVGASRSEADELIADLVANHPADVIANSTLGEMLTGQRLGKMTPHHRHALERAGVRPYGKSIRLGSAVIRVSILRNYPIWKDAAPAQIQAELNKVGSTTPPLSFEQFIAKATVN